MCVSKKKCFNLIALTFLLSPSYAFAQVEVSSATWKNVSGFQYCVSNKCETFKKIETSVNAIKVGEDISITNLETETEIAKFLVKSIKYGRGVKMCWIGNGEPMPSTYITVGGCSKN